MVEIKVHKDLPTYEKFGILKGLEYQKNLEPQKLKDCFLVEKVGGYASGIISVAMDGERCAEAIIAKL